MIFWLSLLTLVGLDQWTKWIARQSPAFHQSIQVIPDFFYLTYVENRGAAFGLLHNQVWGVTVLSVFSLVVVGLLFYAYRQCDSRLLRTGLVLLIAGSIGNLIDRLFMGFVTDFLSFRFWGWEFPSFNLADTWITLGTILAVLVYLLDSSALESLFSRKTA